MPLDRDDSEVPKPKAKASPLDQAEGVAPGGADEGYSTFRPSPVGSPEQVNPKRARATTSKQSRTRPVEGYPGGYEVPAGGPTLWERILFGRVSTGQLAQFCRQFASYLTRASISSGHFEPRKAIQGDRARADSAQSSSRSSRGSTLEAAMAKEPQASARCSSA